MQKSYYPMKSRHSTSLSQYILEYDIDSAKSIVNISIYCIFPSFKSRDLTICILLHSFDLAIIYIISI